MLEDAILEPKPVQKPHPPIMIAGGGEQLTLRAVARLADACNVFGDPDEVRHKFAILRGALRGRRTRLRHDRENLPDQLAAGARRGGLGGEA